MRAAGRSHGRAWGKHNWWASSPVFYGICIHGVIPVIEIRGSFGCEL